MYYILNICYLYYMDDLYNINIYIHIYFLLYNIFLFVYIVYFICLFVIYLKCSIVYYYFLILCIFFNCKYFRNIKYVCKKYILYF